MICPSYSPTDLESVNLDVRHFYKNRQTSWPYMGSVRREEECGEETNVGVRCRNSYDERVPFQYNSGDMWNSDLSVRRYNQYVSVPSCPLWRRFQLFLVCIHHLWSHDSMMLYSSGYFSIQFTLFLRFGNDSWLKVAFWSSRFLNCSLFGHR